MPYFRICLNILTSDIGLDSLSLEVKAGGKLRGGNSICTRVTAGIAFSLEYCLFTRFCGVTGDGTTAREEAGAILET